MDIELFKSYDDEIESLLNPGVSLSEGSEGEHSIWNMVTDLFGSTVRGMSANACLNGIVRADVCGGDHYYRLLRM